MIDASIVIESCQNGSLALYFKTLQFYNIFVDIKSANGLYYSEPITIEQLDDNYYINGYISEWGGISGMFGIYHKASTNIIAIMSQELQTISHLEVQLILSKKLIAIS